MDQSNGKVIFHVIRLKKCLKPSGTDQPVVDRAYVEDELLCSVKCIYAYLAFRSETQHFAECFITYRKPHELASK